MLRAGTQTGSLINHLMSGGKNKIPKVGDGATILGWTDRYPATVIEVSADGKRIVIQEDNAKRIDNNGMSESQQYEYSRNPNATKVVYTLRKDGRYVQLGRPMKGGGNLAIGYRDKYYDFSF